MVTDIVDLRWSPLLVLHKSCDYSNFKLSKTLSDLKFSSTLPPEVDINISDSLHLIGHLQLLQMKGQVLTNADAHEAGSQ